MTDKRLLIPWDEMGGDEKHLWFDDDYSIYEGIVEECTTPLRPPEELSDEETNEIWNAYINSIKLSVPSMRDAMKKYLEIATRPAPKSAVEEMEDIIDDIEGNAECGDLEEAVRGLRGKWQAVKKEIQGADPRGEE